MVFDSGEKDTDPGLVPAWEWLAKSINGINAGIFSDNINYLHKEWLFETGFEVPSWSFLVWLGTILIRVDTMDTHQR